MGRLLSRQFLMTRKSHVARAHEFFPMWKRGFSPCGNEVSKFRLSSFRQLLELIDPFKHFFMAEAALELPKQQFAQARFCVASISMPKSPGLPVPVGLNRRWHKRKATCCCIKFRSMQRAVCAPHCQCSSLACITGP